MSFNEFDPLGEGDEKEWLRYRSEARAAARRFRLTVALLVIGALALIWVTFNGLTRNETPRRQTQGITTEVPPTTNRAIVPPKTTLAPLRAADQVVVADTTRALQEWGEFAISGDIGRVQGYFWANGPQYKELQKEAAGLKRRTIGPPPYQFLLASPAVRKTAEDERVVRGIVSVVRPGEATQTFHWDIYERLDSVGGKDRWRLWTVKTTSGSKQ